MGMTIEMDEGCLKGLAYGVLGLVVTTVIALDAIPDYRARKKAEHMLQNKNTITISYGYDQAGDGLHELPLQTLMNRELSAAGLRGEAAYEVLRKRIEALNPGYAWGTPNHDLRVIDANDDGSFAGIRGKMASNLSDKVTE